MEDLSSSTPSDHEEDVPTDEELTQLRDEAFAAVQKWIMAMARAGRTQMDVAREVSKMMQGEGN